MPFQQCCKLCQFSRWTLTPTGRVKAHEAGRCVVKIAMPVLPTCVSEHICHNIVFPRNGIWPEGGKACPLFQENAGKLKEM